MSDPTDAEPAAQQQERPLPTPSPEGLKRLAQWNDRHNHACHGEQWYDLLEVAMYMEREAIARHRDERIAELERDRDEWKEAARLWREDKTADEQRLQRENAELRESDKHTRTVGIPAAHKAGLITGSAEGRRIGLLEAAEIVRNFDYFDNKRASEVWTKPLVKVLERAAEATAEAQTASEPPSPATRKSPTERP